MNGPVTVPEYHKERLSPISAVSSVEFALLPAAYSRLSGQVKLLVLLATGVFEEVAVRFEGETVITVWDDALGPGG